MMILYQWLSALAALLIAPCFAAYSLFTGKKRRGLRHHFGLVPPLNDKDGSARKTLWLYALSMGEVWAAVPVLQRVRQQRPDIRIVVSTTTDAGYDAIHNHLGFVEKIIYHPLDLWPFPLLAANTIKPDLFVLTETSFWPGLLHILNRKRVPALLFQGRISKKSMRRYRKAAPLVARLLNSFKILCMMTGEGAEAIRVLGVDASKVRVIGNTRFDALKTVSEPRRRQIKESLKIPAEFPVFVAGSTHEGEEEAVLEAFRKLKERHPTLVVVLAPRRIERVAEIAQWMRARDIPFVAKSELSKADGPSANAVLLDTMGELSEIYSIADAVYVGRSLFPPGGGHSLIEPASHGKAVLHGPYVEYNQADADELGKHGVALTVHDAGEMAETILQLLDDEPRRRALGQKAKALIEAKKGAAAKMTEIIFDTLETNEGRL